MNRFLIIKNGLKLNHLNRPNLFNLNTPKYFIHKRNESTTNSPKFQTVEIIQPDSLPSYNNDTKLSIFTDSPITHSIEDILIYIHDSGSFEWSTTIFLAALAFRIAICFPIKIYQEYLMAKLINLQPKLNDALEKSFKSIKKDSMFMSPELKKKLTRQTVIIRNHFYKKENCQPQKIPISSILQMPFWIYLSSAFRNLTYGLNYHMFQMEQIANESFLWLTSLAASDPYHVLPVLYCALALSSVIYSSLSTTKNINKIFSFRKYLSMIFICVIAVFISNMPSSVGLFWIASNVLSFIELILVDSIFIRRLFKIPKTNMESNNIYLTKLNLLMQKLKRFK